MGPDSAEPGRERVTDGRALLERARPTNDAALREALDEAAKVPELVTLVAAVEALGPSAGPSAPVPTAPDQDSQAPASPASTSPASTSPVPA